MMTYGRIIDEAAQVRQLLKVMDAITEGKNPRHELTGGELDELAVEIRDTKKELVALGHSIYNELSIAMFIEMRPAHIPLKRRAARQG